MSYWALFFMGTSLRCPTGHSALSEPVSVALLGTQLLLKNFFIFYRNQSPLSSWAHSFNFFFIEASLRCPTGHSTLWEPVFVVLLGTQFYRNQSPLSYWALSFIGTSLRCPTGTQLYRNRSPLSYWALNFTENQSPLSYWAPSLIGTNLRCPTGHSVL